MSDSNITTSMSRADLPPVIVLSFNRPPLLKTVLESLAGQQGGEIGHRRVCLFQDGAVNRYSRIRYAQDGDIRDCIAVFRSVFPQGEVHASPQNIGVCENIDRAEEYAFKVLDADCAYFFEDDMVLSPVYLQVMGRLQNAALGARIVAYFAAYGDYYATEESIKERADDLMTLDHHWAFGLFRHQWSRIQSRLVDYKAIVVGKDYSRRDHQAIYDLYERQGACPRGTSQDAAKALVCSKLGLWRCRTVTPYAKYLGAAGAHMSPEQYNALGFQRTNVSDETPSRFRFPSEGQMQAFVEDDRALFAEIARSEIPTLRSGLVKVFNPVRKCTEDDVRQIYALLLHRDPEDAGILRKLVGAHNVIEVARRIIASDEYRDLDARVEP